MKWFYVKGRQIGFSLRNNKKIIIEANYAGTRLLGYKCIVKSLFSNSVYQIANFNSRYEVNDWCETVSDENSLIKQACSFCLQSKKKDI